MSSRYKNIQTFEDSELNNYTAATVYPAVPDNSDDLYTISVMGDRFDSLAYEVYSDSSKWWIIAAANPELFRGGMCIEPGKQVRVPAYSEDYVTLFEKVNEN